MDYCEAGTLHRIIGQKIFKRKKFNTSQILRTLAHIVMAVMAMHNKNINHGEIKTHNIFVSSDGICMLKEIGTSRKLGEQNISGNPYFIAPEESLGKRNDRKAADVWYIGVILYELITLKKPFLKDGVTEMLK